MRTILIFIFLSISSVAHAELTCGQLGVIAEETIKYRDDGHSLKQVLTEIEKLEKTKQLNADEIELLKRVATKSFTREAIPYEIVKECEKTRR
jgi:hypothetical protein